MTMHDVSPLSLRNSFSGTPLSSRASMGSAGIHQLAGSPPTHRELYKAGSTPPGSPWASGGARDPATRRRVAAQWVEAVTGTTLPHSTDNAFRAALRDGVLLCRAANAVQPGLIPQVVEAAAREAGELGVTRQRMHNVTNFLTAVQPLLPPDALFTLPDLESDGWEERPRITSCLLHLRSLAGGPPPLSPLRSPRVAGAAAVVAGAGGAEASPRGSPLARSSSAASAAGAPGSRGSPLGGGALVAASGFSPSSAMRAVHEGASSSLALSARGGAGAAAAHALAPAPHHPGALQAAHTKSVQAAAGVTRLMQQCTAMLRDRMFHDAPGGARGGGGARYAVAPASPDTALEAMGPVLESVLGSLTQEYEKRLLSKDHELGGARDNAAALQKQVYTLQAEVQRLRGELEAATAAGRAAAADAAHAELAALRGQLAAAEASARAAAEQLAALETTADEAAAAKAAREATLDGELQAARAALGSLSELEARYARCLEDNRRLHNTVLDLRGAIRVFCRIRPPGATGDPTPPCTDVGLEGDLAVYDSQRGGERKTFKVDCVFGPGAAQEEVYAEAAPLIRSVLDGYNVCIFAYGQTGSGKTHTMSGTHLDQPGGRGINYRALEDLFALRDARADEVTYTIRVQMLEIYNENLRDLLTRGGGGGGGGSPERLDILSTQASGCNVPGARQVEVTAAAEVAAIMARGAANRATSETRMNDRSSRSHQILTVIVDGAGGAGGARSHGCLHLIDLAGSERVGRSEASGDRLIEAQHINRSLSALGDVMAALAAKNAHVPFRNSKLTQLLQDSLGGQAKVMMFMHISPEASMHGETLSTLKFASRVSEITLGQAKRNVESGRVFEAHEAAAAAQQALAEREAAAAAAEAALRSERAALGAAVAALGGERDALAREVQELRAQLDAAKKAALLASGATTHSPAAFVGGVAAAAAFGGGGGGAGAASSPRVGAAALVPRLALDRSPMRDQDSAPPLSARSASVRQPSPLSAEASTGLCTPRGGGGAPRAAPHLERVNSVRLRQGGGGGGGVFCGGGGGGALAALMGGGASAEPAALRRQSSVSSAGYTSMAAARTRPSDVSGSQTARGAPSAASAKQRCADLGPSLTARQSGTFRSGAAAGGGAAAAAAVAAGAPPLSSRASLNSSASRGSRWR